jgi:hypothetical protein
MRVEITEPCTQHISNCGKCATPRYAMKYTIDDTRENIEANGEIRTTLMGDATPLVQNCCN